MTRFSEKIRIAYLSLIILFTLGVFVYLLDTWGVIRLDKMLPIFKKSPPLVSDHDDSPSEIELENLRKREEKLKEDELKLKEEAGKLESNKSDVEKKMEELELAKKGLEEEKKKLEERKLQDVKRSRMIKDMAGRLLAMPPDDAVAIAAGWSNPDLVDVFLQMEKDSEAAGSSSIVPYLLTKMPRDRASVITSLMMDEEARRMPRVAGE
ncbi:MAG: hypothetical protein HY042_04495 [Spirochaetia bacterium]|nr:hypothetical protein [Spirochaetia bacterium]